MKKLLILLFIITLTVLVVFIVPACNVISIFSKVSVKDKIAFVSNRDGNAEIYIMNTDGTEQTRLTDDPKSDSEPCFSPDGSKIVFTSYHPEGYPEIYIMNVDGSGRKQLTYYDEDSYYANYVSYPCFSPDGSKIVYLSYRGGGPITTMNTNGSNKERFIWADLSQDDSYFTLSPDWSKIAVAGNYGEIYLYDIDDIQGMHGVNLTNSPAFDDKPCFSPDGTKIAFRSNRDGNDEIYIMNVDGSEQRRLTNNDSEDTMPCFSPDGSKIAFRSDCDDNKEIYIMNVDGSDLKNLTNNPAYDSRPCFSP